jgi:hypothetical protein
VSARKSLRLHHYCSTLLLTVLIVGSVAIAQGLYIAPCGVHWCSDAATPSGGKIVPSDSLTWFNKERWSDRRSSEYRGQVLNRLINSHYLCHRRQDEVKALLGDPDKRRNVVGRKFINAPGRKAEFEWEYSLHYGYYDHLFLIYFLSGNVIGVSNQREVGSIP